MTQSACFYAAEHTDINRQALKFLFLTKRIELFQFYVHIIDRKNPMRLQKKYEV